MKKTKTILLAVMALISSAVFAGETPGIPKKLEESFGKTFPGVTTPGWVVKDDGRRFARPDHHPTNSLHPPPHLAVRVGRREPPPVLGISDRPDRGRHGD